MAERIHLGQPPQPTQPRNTEELALAEAERKEVGGRSRGKWPSSFSSSAKKVCCSLLVLKRVGPGGGGARGGGWRGTHQYFFPALLLG